MILLSSIEISVPSILGIFLRFTPFINALCRIGFDIPTMPQYLVQAILKVSILLKTWHVSRVYKRLISEVLSFFFEVWFLPLISFCKESSISVLLFVYDLGSCDGISLEVSEVQ